MLPIHVWHLGWPGTNPMVSTHPLCIIYCVYYVNVFNMCFMCTQCVLHVYNVYALCVLLNIAPGVTYDQPNAFHSPFVYYVSCEYIMYHVNICIMCMYCMYYVYYLFDVYVLFIALLTILAPGVTWDQSNTLHSPHKPLHLPFEQLGVIFINVYCTQNIAFDWIFNFACVCIYLLLHLHFYLCLH